MRDLDAYHEAAKVIDIALGVTSQVAESAPNDTSGTAAKGITMSTRLVAINDLRNKLQIGDRHHHGVTLSAAHANTLLRLLEGQQHREARLLGLTYPHAEGDAQAAMALHNAVDLRRRRRC